MVSWRLAEAFYDGFGKQLLASVAKLDVARIVTVQPDQIFVQHRQCFSTMPHVLERVRQIAGCIKYIKIMFPFGLFEDI